MKKITVTIILSVIVILEGCVTTGSNVFSQGRLHYKTALDAYEQKEYQKTIDEVNIIIEQELPLKALHQVLAMHHIAGMSYYHLRQYDKAKKKLEIVAKDGPVEVNRMLDDIQSLGTGGLGAIAGIKISSDKGVLERRIEEANETLRKIK